MTWRDKEAPAADQVAQHVQQYEKQKKGLAPPYVYGPVSQLLILLIKRKDVESTHGRVPFSFTCGTTDRT